MHINPNPSSSRDFYYLSPLRLRACRNNMLTICFSIVIVLLNSGSEVKDWIIVLGFDNYNLKYEVVDLENPLSTINIITINLRRKFLMQ